MCANTVSVRSQPKDKKNFRLMNAEDETLSDYEEEDRDGIVRWHSRKHKIWDKLCPSRYFFPSQSRPNGER